MRHDPTKWTIRALQALGLLLLIAFGAREIWTLLKPLIPALIALVVLAVIFRIIFRRWW